MTDALIKFKNDLYRVVKLDLLRVFSLSQISFTGLQAHSRKKLPYITDPSMYDIAEAGAKGGLNIVAKRITKIKDHKKEKILYTDMKSMCVHTMQQPLPSGGYELMSEPTCAKLLSLFNSINLNTNGALVTCDLVFPVHTHDNLENFPPVFEKNTHTRPIPTSIQLLQAASAYSKANRPFSPSGGLYMYNAGIITHCKLRRPRDKD